MMRKHLISLFLLLATPAAFAAGTTEFCLDGDFNLGARYQGMDPAEDEFVRWR